MNPKLLFIILLLFIMMANLATAQITKRALIIAIGNYPDESGWPQISSNTDVSFIQKALESQNFKDLDIKVVRDKAATADGIKKSLDGLIAESKKGDVVVIDFSSHGEQIEDETDRKINGLEDCIVAYNAKYVDPDSHITRAQFNELTTGYLREDVFGSYVNRLRSKLGPQGDVLIFMDLCHTGVGTRGIAKVRGGKPALTTVDFDKKTFVNAAHIDYDINGTDTDGMSSFEVIGAARSDELDYETTNENHQGMGSLTYAISKVFADTSNTSSITYRTLFAEIRGVMNEKSPLQHPVLAGNGDDKQIFGGRFVTQKHFIEITTINGLKLILDAGILSGLDAGTDIAVYPINTRDTANVKPLATGKITAAGLYESTAYIKQPLKATQPALACVFITSAVYKYAPLKIQIVQNNKVARGKVKTFATSELTNMQKELSTFPLVKFDNENPDLKIVKGNQIDSIIIASDGSTFDTLKNAGTDTADLKKRVQNYMRYVFLKNIKITESDIRLDVKLVPVRNGKPDTSEVLKPNPAYSFVDGDTVMIWVSNKSRKKLYFNILDMQPDGIINAVVPYHVGNTAIDAEELYVDPGVSHLFSADMIAIRPPFGTEVFKVFVSDKLIDMEIIANTGGSGTRSGSFTRLEGLVKESYTKVGTRGAIPNVGNSNGTVYNLLFEIKEKK